MPIQDRAHADNGSARKEAFPPVLPQQQSDSDQESVSLAPLPQALKSPETETEGGGSDVIVRCASPTTSGTPCRNRAGTCQWHCKATATPHLDKLLKHSNLNSQKVSQPSARGSLTADTLPAHALLAPRTPPNGGREGSEGDGRVSNSASKAKATDRTLVWDAQARSPRQLRTSKLQANSELHSVMIIGAPTASADGRPELPHTFFDFFHFTRFFQESQAFHVSSHSIYDPQLRKRQFLKRLERFFTHCVQSGLAYSWVVFLGHGAEVTDEGDQDKGSWVFDAESPETTEARNKKKLKLQFVSFADVLRVWDQVGEVRQAQHEAAGGEVRETRRLVILTDSCFGGTWVQRARARNDVAVQSSCSADEQRTTSGRYINTTRIPMVNRTFACQFIDFNITQHTQRALGIHSATPRVFPHDSGHSPCSFVPLNWTQDGVPKQLHYDDDADDDVDALSAHVDALTLGDGRRVRQIILPDMGQSEIRFIHCG